MKFFKNIENMKADFEDFSARIERLIGSLSEYELTETDNIKLILESFERLTKDFLSEDKLLNIGVIGQVKTGRSTFLNTLLFDGESIIPTAVTPKTVTLTKIQYAEKTYAEIEYYQQEEWNLILKKSLTKHEDNVALEIVKSLKNKNLDVNEFIGAKPLILTGEGQEFRFALNNYIGENGKYTPIVKSVNLYINKRILKNLCIVDTPGINDPVISRTVATKDYLENCDVVFFLSRASQFLDTRDVDLLVNIIPKKGVKKLVLICSRYDEGLADTLPDYDDFDTADIETKKALTERAGLVFREIFDKETKRNVSKDFINTFRKISSPIFLSSAAFNLSRKFVEDYNAKDMRIFKNLNYFKNITPEILKNIGNFESVRGALLEVTGEKERILEKRAGSFVPEHLLRVQSELTGLRYALEKRITLLSLDDEDVLFNEKEFMLEQSGRVCDEVDKVFDGIIEALEKEKAATAEVLRAERVEFEKMHEEALKLRYSEKRKTDKRWYNPFTWGKTADTEIIFEKEYSVIKVNEALEKIKDYAKRYEQTADKNILCSLNSELLRGRLLEVIMETCDRSSESYDPLYFNSIVKRTVNSIRIPSLSIDIYPYLKIVAEKFTGELKAEDDKRSLKILLAICITDIYENAEGEFADQIDNFSANIQNIKEGFYNKLSDNIKAEYDLLLYNFQDKETRIADYKKILKKVNYQMEQLV